jgi:tetratricopeptide (TPR) repeat protein
LLETTPVLFNFRRFEDELMLLDREVRATAFWPRLRVRATNMQTPISDSVPRRRTRWIPFIIAVACLAFGIFVFLKSRRGIADVVCGFGEIALRDQQVDRAIREFDWAVRIDPTFAIAFNDRGLVSILYGEYGEAMRDFDEAIRLDSHCSKAFANRGLTWIYQGKPDKSLSDLDEAIRLNPRDAMATSNRGFAWYTKGNLDRAFADYDQAIRLDSTLAQSFDFRGLAWKVRGNYERSIADLREAIRLDPNRPSALNNLAWLEATCTVPQYRDGKQAVVHAARACELSGWKNVNRLLTLAAAYAEVGDFPNAIKWTERATELSPSESGALRESLKLFKAGKPYRDERPEFKGFMNPPSSHDVHF